MRRRWLLLSVVQSSPLLHQLRAALGHLHASVLVLIVLDVYQMPRSVTEGVEGNYSVVFDRRHSETPTCLPADLA